LGRDVRGVCFEFGGEFGEYLGVYVCIRFEYDDLFCADGFVGDVGIAFCF